VRILDRSLSRLPRPFRTVIDWALTLCLAVVGILVFQAEVAKPYRIPTSSMEPTLHCGKPTDGCRARISDRVIANRIVYRFQAPERGDIIVFNAPVKVAAACNAGGAFVKRIIGLPGEKVSMRGGYVLIDGVRLNEPYLATRYRGRESGEWPRSPREGYFVLASRSAP
jgi:signal peptidase I